MTHDNDIPQQQVQKNIIISDVATLKKVQAKILTHAPNLELAAAEVSVFQETLISEHAHLEGACGGYIFLGPSTTEKFDASRATIHLEEFGEQQSYNTTLRERLKAQEEESSPNIKESEHIKRIIERVSRERFEQDVRWLSTKFPTRFHDAYVTHHNHSLYISNLHVYEMAEKIRKLIQDNNIHGKDVKIKLLDHAKTYTKQKSIKVRVEGNNGNSETVVLGAHLDTIHNPTIPHSTRRFPSDFPSPGADDNASGSAAILEVLRVFLQENTNSERAVEFFWYAAEEVGMRGSRNIAETYRSANKDVVGVLQLDMMLYPGAYVENKNDETKKPLFGYEARYTNPWLTNYLLRLNDIYTKAAFEETRCPHPCSDHVSWHKKGYPAIFPLEAPVEKISPDRHSGDDIISDDLKFEHGLVLLKLALAFALDFSNSTQRSP